MNQRTLADEGTGLIRPFEIAAERNGTRPVPPFRGPPAAATRPG
jgi:hypothetical protein